MHDSMERVFTASGGMSPSELAVALDESPQNITNWSKRGISKAGAIKASVKFNVDVNWLLTGKQSPQSQLSIDKQIGNFLDGSTQAVTTDDLSHDEQSEKIWIDMYDVQFCSGVGVPVEFQFDQIKKQLSFEPSFFAKRSINKKNFRIIINKGDSNEEYLFDGDAVGIDISDTDIVDGETYALYFEGDALIRKIFKEQGGMLRLHPRNPKYQDKIVDTKLENIESSFKIIGRVRYRSG